MGTLLLKDVNFFDPTYGRGMMHLLLTRCQLLTFLLVFNTFIPKEIICQEVLYKIMGFHD